MGANFLDLMYKYPKAANRLSERYNPSESDKLIAKKFGKEFFDGDRKYGYGGFSYDPKFWSETVKLFIERYNLNESSSILDVGCGKGFMLVDFLKAIPSLKVAGIDISNYAIENSHELVRNQLKVANCLNLPFPDKSFDLVISINTIHNLDVQGCIKSIQEIERVKKKHSYIVVDGWNTLKEEQELKSWVLTAVTLLQTSEWEKLFKKAGYTGDYSFWKVS
jgi:ubiquinone/menaquinone biosynthesis C-methylase UbiE